MKGWLDNFGKAANANDSDVSLPEGFVGIGYNTKGRNYSPAWGGQFQRGGKLIPVSPMQQITGETPTISPTVPYLQTKDPAEFYKSWIQSPEYERRLKSTGYSDVPNRWHTDKLSEIEKVKKERLGLLENIQPLEYDRFKRSEAIIYDENGPTININPSDYEGSSRQSVEAHEIAHVATPPGTMGGDEFGIFMGSMLDLKKPIVSGSQGSKEREASIEAVGDFQHSQKPWEAKADLDALRFMMYDKGIYDITKGKKFTESDFEKAKQSFGKDRVFKRLADRMGKENFVKLMNTIAKADGDEQLPLAMGGMSIPGSVGFTYARTAGSAPSKGKYAKKTMASAQNGIMSPLLLGRKILEYIYPSEEATTTVEAAPTNYKKGLTNELLQRQAYKESTFNPAAVSPAGYKGLTQIGEGVLEDYSKKKGGKKLDPFNPKDAVELQKFAMDDLYNASFINKPEQSDSVRIAKTLAAYNWGRGNLANYLNEQKSKGVDIYGSYDWLNNLPKETSDYVNKILLQEDPSFNKNYKKASTNPKYEEVTSLYDQKEFGGDIPSAQKGKKVSKDATRVDSNASDKFWGIQRELDAQNLSDDSFREKYGMPLHQFKMRDSEYASAFNRQMEQRRMSDPNYAELNLPQTDVRSKIYQGNPNLRFIPGTSDGESRAAMEDLFLATTTATAPLLPVNTAKIAKGAQQFGKYLTEETALRNAYKYNPLAFKPNSKSYYRGLGQAGLEDAFETGVLRANATGKNLTNGEVYNNPFFDTGRTELANVLGDGIISEVSGFPMKEFSPNHLGVVPYDINTGKFLESIPVNENVKFLQKDWLKGYKEVPQNRVFKSGLPNPIEMVDKIIPRPLAPGSFFGLDDSWNNYSPLNLIPGYGRKLIDKSSSYPNFVGFRKFGNSIDDVIESQSLRPRGSGMGSNQIRSEGNWAESGKVNENYPGVFEATMNPQIQGSNIKLEKISKRNGILGTTNEGDVEIPITDPGLSFNRRLPFSNRYAPIDKEKLINNQFQMSTVAPNLQSLAEKYAIWSGLGLGASSLGYPQLSDANKKYIIDPAVEKYKDLDERLYKLYDQILPSLEIPKKQNGGEMKFYQNGLDWKPKSMQPGGNIERVSTSDPRYPELYKNRQVGSYYDGAYSLPDLDEVIVTAPRSYTMDSLRDFTTAALYGAPANAMKVSMIPQAAMTEGIEALRGEPYDFSNVNPNFGGFTSNQRDLSQTMGYENPEGFLQNVANIGLSMIDPAILMGGKSTLKQPFKKGLKKVDIQKSSPVSFVDDVDKGFKSEIDWSKWNPETPNYPELINEYNAIEETTKKAGTWMKNSDGSEFQGTPEQFVQQQSSYFKKAYPKGYDEVYRGVNRNNSFSDFNENTDSSLTGPRGMFTADKDLAKSYIFGEKRTLTPFDADKTPGLFELIYPKGKQITYDTESSHWTGIDLEKIPSKENLKNKIEDLKKSTERKKRINNEMYANDEDSRMAKMASEDIKVQERAIERLQKYYNDFDNIKNEDAAFNKMKKTLDKKPATDDIAKYIPETNLRSMTLKNIIDGGFGDVTIVNNRPGNYLKSKVGNVGFFDLKNPNVYKGVIPAGVATALTFDQQKNGGITKDNQGYWNPDNWGKPVEIDSNNITMEGVYEPLLGVSDTGDTKLMKPGKNYKFKGKKVTEFPVAELGINQLDAQPMKKLNQLLNFTNNPDKDNWLDKYN
jgi:hypothetical protein